MDLLIRFDRKGEIHLNKDALGLSTHLKRINKQQLKYIHLAYDYNSLLHQFPEHDRKLKAFRRVFPKPDSPDPEEDKAVQLAIEEYMGFQYDSKREILDAYKTKISKLTKMLITEEDAGELAKIDKTLTMFTTRIKEIQGEIDKVEDEIQMRGGGSRSTVEIFQLNMKQRKRDLQLAQERTGFIDIS